MFKKLFSVTMLVGVLALGVHAQAQTQSSTDEDAQYRREFKAEMIPKYHKQHQKAVIMSSVGGALFGGGIIMTIIGAKFIQHSPPLYNYYGYPNTAADEDAAQKRRNGLWLVSFGPIAIVHGIVVGAMGIHAGRKAHKMKAKGDKIGVDITYEPIISPINNTYGMSFSMTF